MPPSDSSALIVARFLKSNHYTKSYEAFIREAGLPETAGDVSKGDLTLETLLEEKKTFDLSSKFEKLGTSDASKGWTAKAPSEANTVSLPNSSNMLSSTIVRIIDETGQTSDHLLATTVNSKLHILDIPSCVVQSSLSSLHDSPILCCTHVLHKIILSTSMSGKLVASTLAGDILDKRKDHLKYVVQIAVYEPQSRGQASGGEFLIATAAWDNKIHLYRPATPNTVAAAGGHERETFRIGEPIATIALPSNPQSILFLEHPDTLQPILLLARADSSFLYYYTTEPEPRLLGKQNLAPHSNAWVSFTPSSLALCPTDSTLVAIGTSTVPHMKLLIVRLLIPPFQSVATPVLATRASLLDAVPDGAETIASRTRAELAIADREAAAIIIHCTTMAPQTAYSTPAVAWRPDGSGVWVNGDDGTIRGVEASTGKVMATLKGAHDEGTKVRCLWAGNVEGLEGEEEWLVSGGFDQRLVVWKAS